MKIHDIEQGTEEWFEIRKGKLTASNAQAISANGKGLQTYVKNIVLSIFTENESYQGSDMKRGHELEPIARTKYEFEKNVTVKEVGFIEYSKEVGYSPDGLVGEEGLVEIKARNNSIHLDLLMNGTVDTKTIWQMQMGLLITGRKWCDFVSYNPNFKNSIFIKRFYPDEIAFQKLNRGLASGIKLLRDYKNSEIIKKEINE